MKENIKKWIIGWCEENCDVENKEIQNSLNDNYFNNGWIDSLKFIVFVEKIESNFNIRFSILFTAILSTFVHDCLGKQLNIYFRPLSLFVFTKSLDIIFKNSSFSIYDNLLNKTWKKILILLILPSSFFL